MKNMDKELTVPKWSSRKYPKCLKKFQPKSSRFLKKKLSLSVRSPWYYLFLPHVKNAKLRSKIKEQVWTSIWYSPIPLVNTQGSISLPRTTLTVHTICMMHAWKKQHHWPSPLHTANLYYIDPYMSFAASGGKLRPWLAKYLLCFLAWIKVASLQDIAVNDEGGKFLQKRDLQY